MLGMISGFDEVMFIRQACYSFCALLAFFEFTALPVESAPSLFLAHMEDVLFPFSPLQELLRMRCIFRLNYFSLLHLSMKSKSDQTHLIMNMTFALGIMVIFEGHSVLDGQGLQFGNNVVEAVIFRHRHILVTGDIGLRYLLRSQILRASLSPYISGVLQVR